MKLKLDENLPESLVAELAALGHDVDNVRQEGLAGQDDPQIWAAAQREGRFLLTQDLDFSDLRQFQPGTHHGLLLVRLPDAGAQVLIEQIVNTFKRERVQDWAKCFVVISDHKLRVVRPPREPKSGEEKEDCVRRIKMPVPFFFFSLFLPFFVP